MAYFKPTVLRYGDLVTGADLDTYFDNLLAVANGSLEGANFSPDAGIALANRQTQGNRMIVSGGAHLATTAAITITPTPALVDIGDAADHHGVPAVCRVLDLGMSVQEYSPAIDPADDVFLQWRGYNTRTNAWTAWANTSVNKPAAGAAGHDTTINAVISDRDYSKFQLRVNLDGASVGGFELRGLAVWAVLEALHLP